MRTSTSAGYHSEIYADLDELGTYPPRSGIIVVRDTDELGGIGAAIERLLSFGISLPVLAISDEPSPERVVQAIKVGALDYLTLPLRPERLQACLAGLEHEAARVSHIQQRTIDAQRKLAALSPRELEVLDLLATGGSNKEIARQLAISPRTVEIHRANMMTKIQARHSSEAIRLRMEASELATFKRQLAA